MRQLTLLLIITATVFLDQSSTDNWTLSLCSDVMVTADSTLYLKTPAFPRGSDVSNTLCTCKVEGQGLTVTVLDLDFDYGTLSGNVGFLVISNSTAELWRSRGDSVLINRKVMELGTQHFVNVSFHDQGAQKQSAWLKISATSGSLSLACGNSSQTLTTKPPSLSTTNVAPSSTAPTSGNYTTTVEMSSIQIVSSSTVQSSTFPETSSSDSTLPSDGSNTAPDSQLTPSTPDPATDLSGMNDNTVAIAAPAAVGGVVAVTIVIVVVVICRRRSSRRRSDDLERMPGPKGDLYTLSGKKKRDPLPSASDVFKDHDLHSDGGQPTKASLQNGVSPPGQVHHNPAFSPDPRAEDRYVSNVSLASHVYQEIGDLDLDPAGVRVRHSMPQKSRGSKSVMFMSVKPPAPVSNAEEDDSSTKPKSQYWDVLSDDELSKYEAENQKHRATSHQYKDAQPYAVSDLLTRRKTTGAKVEVVPLRTQTLVESDSEQANVDERPRKEMNEIAPAKNAENSIKNPRQSKTDNPAVKKDSDVKNSDVFESDSSAQAAKSERKRYDPYADYEAVDMNDTTLECADTPPLDSDNTIPPVTSRTDFDPYAGYQPVHFDDEEEHVKARPVSRPPEASRIVNQYEDIDCEDKKPKLQNTKNADDCLVYNILYESSKGLGNSSTTRSDGAGTDSCSEMTENTDVADEESEATSGASVVDDHGEGTPGQGKGITDEDCLVDNILYESSQHILDSNK